MGPVALWTMVLLLVLAPLMRGGNRHVALIALEAVGVAYLAMLALRATTAPQPITWSVRGVLVAVLVTSPLWLAVIYLLPVPAPLWSALPGREGYLQWMAAVGMAPPGALPLSLAPDATTVSLLAGIPVMAAFLAGFTARSDQLRTLVIVIVGIAFLQVAMGLLQVAGGVGSTLYFGRMSMRPVGTFANPNHFGNYLAMALVAYAWLAWTQRQERKRRRRRLAARPMERHATALWWAGGVVLVAGLLMSQSRGAAVAGLFATLLVMAAMKATSASHEHSWRFGVLLLLISLAAGLVLVGLDSVLARFELKDLVASASTRGLLASTTFDGAVHFWPWGAGWGTYAAVYPRFQPPSIIGLADHAHHDYVQILFEGGVFGLLLMLVFAWLAVDRGVRLVRAGLSEERLRSDQLACLACGLALLGFLLHSLVDFSMHIPANAIVAALLAGAFLRPLPRGSGETA